MEKNKFEHERKIIHTNIIHTSQRRKMASFRVRKTRKGVCINDLLDLACPEDDTDSVNIIFRRNDQNGHSLSVFSAIQSSFSLMENKKKPIDEWMTIITEKCPFTSNDYDPKAPMKHLKTKMKYMGQFRGRDVTCLSFLNYVDNQKNSNEHGDFPSDNSATFFTLNIDVVFIGEPVVSSSPPHIKVPVFNNPNLCKMALVIFK